VTQKVPAGFPNAKTVSYRPDIAAMDPAVAKGTMTTASPLDAAPNLAPAPK